MPLFEYDCDQCHDHFEVLVRQASQAVQCPKCGTTSVSKCFSVPAAPASAKAPMPAGCCDPQKPRCGSGCCCHPH